MRSMTRTCPALPDVPAAIACNGGGHELRRSVARQPVLPCWRLADMETPLSFLEAGLAELEHAIGARGADVARARRDALSENARRPYGLRAHPGTQIADPQDQPHLPSAERFAQFAVILVTLGGMDMLRLGEDGGQTRAAGDLGCDRLAARWVGA